MTGALILFVLALSFISALIASKRAVFSAGGVTEKVHSRPIYHGLNTAIWAGAPALLIVLVWLFAQSTVIDSLVVSTIPSAATATPSEQALMMSEVRQNAAGRTFKEPSEEIRTATAAYKSLQTTAAWAMAAIVAAVAVAGAALGLRAIEPRFRARHSFERAVTIFMLFSSLVAIVTTAGIVASLIFEAGHFFAKVPVTEFLFGLRWEPQIAMRADQVAGQGAFGVIPVIFGTILISLIAMIVAVPIGILSAIYLTEYSPRSFRAVVKPLLEILAGVPTVVYGFFAVLTVAPAIRNFGLFLGLDASPNSSLAAGLVMGIMIIPLISSLADDALAAVPRAMRDGSLALGSTKSETIKKVLIPAALPGIVGGVLLALSRAIGETMIVVMAAGLIAKITLNPFDSVTTVTVQIVTLLTGDAEFDNPKTLAAFALGLVLFIITLILNIIALQTVRKYREKY
ncbi:phosphate ABC transporter permease subunit PstC [Rhizobium sp. TRM95796]|uniref:phosphate ABC transporter permease subunit PstC n=1 Tax=Rhizobium sp. TRM95796 TaxID=2979862 RepID=UPI0021E891D7|nr:phosphate ABC transporter permease subunit PstC [Rhizobium sp. TRM95796]MCV3767101.1 phosphate ABC transporter permease subunit PstC [Rhizobium sp. TRM95796]